MNGLRSMHLQMTYARRLGAFLMAALLCVAVLARATRADAPTNSADQLRAAHDAAQLAGAIEHVEADVRAARRAYAVALAKTATSDGALLHADPDFIATERRNRLVLQTMRARLQHAELTLTIADHARLVWGLNIIDSPNSSIFGPSMLTAQAMADFAARAHTHVRATVPLLTLAWLFIDEGEHEGVRGDVAFAQAMLETGTFSSFVGPNNFGALGGCATCSHDGFATARDGVRAQIQLLRWRADASLHSARDFAAQPATLPARFLRTGHGGTTWASLGGRWSPDPSYGLHVYALYLRMVESHA